MVIIKKHIKILNYIHRHRDNSHALLLSKFNPRDIEALTSSQYISCDFQFESDADGFNKGVISPYANYTVTHLGISEIEKHQWFDLQYFSTHIVVPIVIAIITTLLTIAITSNR